MVQNRFQTFLYKIKFVEQLKDSDYTARAEFGDWWLQTIQANWSLLIRAIYSEERLLDMNQKVNEHNVRIWGSERPRSKMYEKAAKLEYTL